MLFIFSTPVLIRYLWQLKTVVFLHWCRICAVPLNHGQNFTLTKTTVFISAYRLFCDNIAVNFSIVN